MDKTEENTEINADEQYESDDSVNSINEYNSEELELDNEDEGEEEEDDEFDFSSNEVIVDKKDRISRPFMTKYELVRIIGTRKKQLSMGAKPMIKITGDIKNFTINDIIKEEIKNNMIPFKIKRPQSDSNKIEVWDFSELSHKHLNIVW